MTTPFEYGPENEDGTIAVENTPIGQAKQTIQLMDPREFQQMRRWFLREEIPRRESATAQAEMIKNLRDNGHVPCPAEPTEPTGLEDFSDWVNPGTDHGAMYLRGDRVAHNGAVWESQVDGLNSWEPGGPGVYSHIWADITDMLTPPVEPTEPEPSSAPDFVQPTGGHDAYKVGDRVRFNGAVYESIIDNNVWSPDAHPAGWTTIEEA